eukprot:CAMPEP_0173182638 /NCGR_PEP_ID=MMETSP1141-20130122/7955_1 /TAXON_ID=483371 /ORGANISM="non described non described, Strain CCMP2298" /LENGTH=586 /DNA_ID=CAMNT_0014105767 /DNA_START=48 /DNA_END=1808 /DNA_ORIENTATION=+
MAALKKPIVVFFLVLALVLGVILVRSLQFYQSGKGAEGAEGAEGWVIQTMGAVGDMMKPLYHSLEVIEDMIATRPDLTTGAGVGVGAGAGAGAGVGAGAGAGVRASLPVLTTKTNGAVAVGASIIASIPCDDAASTTKWCSVAMPEKSLFRFPKPVDLARWRWAQAQAASGEQVLLRQARKVFPTPFDFLEGSILFKKYHTMSDIFLDKNSDFSQLTPDSPPPPKRHTYPWEHSHHDVIPKGYDFRASKRAPVVQVGYFAFGRQNKSEYFEGPALGEAGLELPNLLDKWKAHASKIDTPFVVIHQANENWGLLSTVMPGRTIDWGTCCGGRKAHIHQMLADANLLMLAVNQHHNLTHPKLISLPRGLPTFMKHRKIYIWDQMRLLEGEKKADLVFASNSNWKHRPFVSACIANKFLPEGDSKSGKKKTIRIPESQYYKKVVTSRTSICLPGLGYDSFRLWETMTLGTVAVLEKGTGLDKSLWRLPALLVEDFDQVTPALLQTAYVEALYRAEEFEFKRLTQSFWFGLVMNVSAARSSQPLLDLFPPESEDPTFTQPKERFDCWESNSCGKGTKRISKSFCAGEAKG